MPLWMHITDQCYLRTHELAILVYRRRPFHLKKEKEDVQACESPSEESVGGLFVAGLNIADLDESVAPQGGISHALPVRLSKDETSVSGAELLVSFFDVCPSNLSTPS